MQEVRVAVSAFFTAEPLAEPLEFLFGILGKRARVEFAPFAQVFQTLLDPQGLFGRNPDAVHIVLARPADVKNSLDSFVDALLHSLGETLVQICAPHDFAVEEELRARLGTESQVVVLASSELERRYPVTEVFDSRASELGAIPYTREYFAALSMHLARTIDGLHRPPCKVIALDCDDTLWRGVCGEDGPEGVVLDPPHRALQEFMRQQRSGGRLLAIASKNNDADVEDTFRKHPEFPLGFDDFAAKQIHWEPKAQSLEAIATELNVDIDSIAFLDNDAKEVGEVVAQLPMVAAIALPPDGTPLADFLAHLWLFDSPRVATSEDAARAELYAAEARRDRERRQANSLQEFLAGLDLRVTFEAVGESQLARVAQLTQRTNQMNTTTRRLTQAALRLLLRDGTGFCVKVKDRLGDYGLVGFVWLTEQPGALRVDSFLLSCRALGRGVEHRMLRRVGEIALERGFPAVNVEFEKTGKNIPAHDFLTQTAGGEGPFVFSSAELATLEWRQPTTLPVRATGNAEVSAPGEERAADYQRLAELRNPADLVAAMLAEKGARAARRADYQRPQSDLERRLCVLWEELLGVGNIGASDNFFDLGGHSLLAVQLVSRLQHELEIDLPLEAVYNGALTVAELARSIELFQLEQVDSGEYAALLAEVEKLSEEEVEALLAAEPNGAARIPPQSL